MKIFIFRTDIKTKKKVNALKKILNNYPTISSWSIDTEDIDNVLRIEGLGNLREKDIISLIRTYGFYCDVLTDEAIIK